MSGAQTLLVWAGCPARTGSLLLYLEQASKRAVLTPNRPPGLALMILILRAQTYTTKNARKFIHRDNVSVYVVIDCTKNGTLFSRKETDKAENKADFVSIKDTYTNYRCMLTYLLPLPLFPLSCCHMTSISALQPWYV